MRIKTGDGLLNRRRFANRSACAATSPERDVKLGLVVSALLIAGVRLAHAQTDAPTEAVRRNVYQAVVFAMAADSLCGTAYLKNVIDNAGRDGVTLDDIMRRDKAQIDERANGLIAQYDSQERKDKFCAMVKRDAESAPEE